MTFKQGDRVLLLSVPFGPDATRDETDEEGVGEVHTVNAIDWYVDEPWYDVGGWLVKERNIRKAEED